MSNEKYSSNFWQEYKFRLEPWRTDYEPPIQLIEDLSPSQSDVDPTVETEDWECFQPDQPLQLPTRLIFIDGRRRIDASLVGGSGNTVAYGVFGTIAVGAVVVDRTIPHANCTQITIRRVLGFGGEQQAVLTRIPCPLGSKAELVYEPAKPSIDNTPAVRGLIVQNAMLAAEEQLVSQQTNDTHTLVIRDGRLSHKSANFVLGYVKTMQKNYLSEKYAAMLWQLSPQTRSPIFLIKEQNRPRYSWYIKSGDGSAKKSHHDLHGIVRLELSSEISLEAAKEIANQTSYLIPQYASHPSRDPRAPQNLTPVGALERKLGRRMGNAALITRRLQNFMASL
jgi:uncharacterized protein